MTTALIALLVLSQADVDLDAGSGPESPAAESPLDAGVPEGPTLIDPTLLGVLFKKSILTQAEYEAAVSGLPPPDEGRSPAMAKWAASLYGFVELDVVGDSTQTAFEQPANSAIARPGTYEGDHSRVSIGARNSRLGLKLSTPVVGGMRANAIIEADLLGNTVTPNNDAVIFTGGGTRIRHLAITVETPYVDFLVGQFWQPFGWQPNFFPNTLEIQGVIGEVYGRIPQVKLSHVFKTAPVNLELELALTRPVERLFGVPDGVAGVRLAFNGRKGVRTSGATATRADTMMLGASTLLRHFSVAGASGGTAEAWGWGLSLDAFVPLIAGNLEHRANALTLNAAFVTGAGIADQQSGFTAGIGSPAPSIDNGLVVLAGDQLYPIVWRTFRVGLQYYLPPSGNVWVAVNWAQNLSPNAGDHGQADKVYTVSRIGDVSVFWNLFGALRLGVEYAFSWQRYADGVEAHDHRGIFAAFFLF